MSRQKCRQCEKEFKSISQHWSASKECDYRNLTKRQKEICKGMLMGDAYINIQKGSNGMLRAKMITEEFLQWLYDELNPFSSNLESYMSPKESFNDTASRFENSVTKVGNYSEIFEYRTCRHPYFTEMRGWYSGGKKSFPDNLELTPLSAKVWLCCDGSVSHTNGKRINIYSSNESDRPEYLKSLLDEFNPTWIESSSCLRINASNYNGFFDWIGNPLPGFEYKWRRA
jgi:hypothetical protein